MDDEDDEDATEVRGGLPTGDDELDESGVKTLDPPSTLTALPLPDTTPDVSDDEKFEAPNAGEDNE
jgi:hypothetical protein